MNRIFEEAQSFLSALAVVLAGALLAWGTVLAAFWAFEAGAQTVTKNGAQVSTVSGRWAELADGGCTLQADCTFINPAVVCVSAPQDARPAICAMMKNSFTRAATISNAVGDGGQP